MCDSCPRHHGYPCAHTGHCWSENGMAWHMENDRRYAVRRIARRVALLSAIILAVYIVAVLAVLVFLCP